MRVVKLIFWIWAYLVWEFVASIVRFGRAYQDDMASAPLKAIDPRAPLHMAGDSKGGSCSDQERLPGRYWWGSSSYAVRLTFFIAWCQVLLPLLCALYYGFWNVSIPIYFYRPAVLGGFVLVLILMQSVTAFLIALSDTWHALKTLISERAAMRLTRGD